MKKSASRQQKPWVRIFVRIGSFRLWILSVYFLQVSVNIYTFLITRI